MSILQTRMKSYLEDELYSPSHSEAFLTVWEDYIHFLDEFVLRLSDFMVSFHRIPTFPIWSVNYDQNSKNSRDKKCAQ